MSSRESTLGLRNDGNLCVAYFDNDNNQVKYACNNGSGCSNWTVETVASADVGSPSIPADNWEELGSRDLVPKDRVRLAFNNKGAPYVVYHNAGNNSINIALKENNQWNSYPLKWWLSWMISIPRLHPFIHRQYRGCTHLANNQVVDMHTGCLLTSCFILERI